MHGDQLKMMKKEVLRRLVGIKTLIQDDQIVVVVLEFLDGKRRLCGNHRIKPHLDDGIASLLGSYRVGHTYERRPHVIIDYIEEGHFFLNLFQFSIARSRTMSSAALLRVGLNLLYLDGKLAFGAKNPDSPACGNFLIRNDEACLTAWTLKFHL